jgi:hypothetical protein
MKCFINSSLGTVIMNYDDRIVCFLDILGFKKLILSSVDANGTECPIKIAKILSGIRDILDVDRPEERFSIEVTQFSDSEEYQAIEELMEDYMDLIDNKGSQSRRAGSAIRIA